MTRCKGQCICRERCTLEAGHHPSKPFADAKGRVHTCDATGRKVDVAEGVGR